MSRITGVTFVIIRPSWEILMQLRDGNSKESSEDELKTVIREIEEEYGLIIDTKDCKELMVYELNYGVSAKVFICMCDEDKKPVLHEGADMKWMRLDDIKKIKLGFEQEKIIPKLEKFL